MRIKRKNIYILNSNGKKTAVTSLKNAAAFLGIDAEEVEKAVAMNRIAKGVKYKKEAFPVEVEGITIERIDFAVNYAL